MSFSKVIAAGLTLLLWATSAQADITYHGSSTGVPADTGSNGASPITLTPPASMVNGDLVVVVLLTKDVSGSYSIPVDGGQSWTIETQATNGGVATTVAHCTFNGSWGADPQFATTNVLTNGYSAVMHVFRPTLTGATWSVDVAKTDGAISSGVSPTTLTGINTTGASTVSVFVFSGSDDNVFGGLSGTGWAAAGSQQYRNQTGNDSSHSTVYRILTSSGATGDVTQNFEETGGGTSSNAGGWLKIAFLETGGSSGSGCKGALLLRGAGC